MTRNTFYKNCSRSTLCKLWVGENWRGRSYPPRQIWGDVAHVSDEGLTFIRHKDVMSEHCYTDGKNALIAIARLADERAA